jgi:hypothetical protein
MTMILNMGRTSGDSEGDDDYHGEDDDYHEEDDHV